MASRYADQGGNQGGTTTTSKAPTYTDSSSFQNSNSNTQFNETDVTNTTNMSSEALAALNSLISQLQNGGTSEQKNSKHTQDLARQQILDLLGNYTKSSAKHDAEGYVAQTLRQALEANQPAITKSIEGAGTSASSMQGLLSQQLAVQSSQAASAAGLDASEKYGQISANLAAILENASRPNNEVTTALLNALGISKGAVQNSVTTKTGNSNTTGNQTGGSSSVQTGGDTTSNFTPDTNYDSSGNGYIPTDFSGNIQGSKSSKDLVNQYLDIQVNDPYSTGKALDQAVQTGNFDWSNASQQQLDALTDYYNS